MSVGFLFSRFLKTSLEETNKLQYHFIWRSWNRKISSIIIILVIVIKERLVVCERGGPTILCAPNSRHRRTWIAKKWINGLCKNIIWGKSRFSCIFPVYFDNLKALSSLSKLLHSFFHLVFLRERNFFIFLM